MPFSSFLIIKIVSLLTVWLPAYDIIAKKHLTVIFVIKLFVDFSMTQPHGEPGKIRILAKKISKKYGHIIANLLVLILNLIMAFVAFKYKAWIPAVIATVITLANLFEINND